MKRFWRALVLAAVLLPVAASAQAQGFAGDCAKLSIRLEGIPEADGARCSGSGWYESIDASGPASLFQIRHQSTSDGRTYFWRLTAAEILSRLHAAAPVELQGEEVEVGNFDVLRYRAKMDEQQAACFVFVRYAGHVAHSTGYRHSVVGVYCNLAGEAATDARVSELLSGVVADFW